MPGNIKIFKDKVNLYGKLLKVIKTVKAVTVAKYMKAQERTQNRDASVRFARKAFDQAIWANASYDPAEKTCAIPITTNRGTCGALNSRIMKHFSDVLVSNHNVQIVVVGKKGFDSAPRLFPELCSRAVVFEGNSSSTLSSIILGHAFQLEWDKLRILYTRFITAGKQEMSELVIPKFDVWWEYVTTKAHDADEAPEGQIANHRFYNALLNAGEDQARQFYEFQVHALLTHAMLENQLSELAARMAAVENQLTNIAKLRDWAQRAYNKTRQANITGEMLELTNSKTAIQKMLSKQKAEKKAREEAAAKLDDGGDDPEVAKVLADLRLLQYTAEIRAQDQSLTAKEREGHAAQAEHISAARDAYTLWSAAISKLDVDARDKERKRVSTERRVQLALGKPLWAPVKGVHWPTRTSLAAILGESGAAPAGSGDGGAERPARKAAKQ